MDSELSQTGNRVVNEPFLIARYIEKAPVALRPPVNCFVLDKKIGATVEEIVFVLSARTIFASADALKLFLRYRLTTRKLLLDDFPVNMNQ